MNLIEPPITESYANRTISAPSPIEYSNYIPAPRRFGHLHRTPCVPLAFSTTTNMDSASYPTLYLISYLYDLTHGGLAPSNFVGGGEERGSEMPQPEELDENTLTPYFPPDGSYVWMGSQLASGWQVQAVDHYPGPATIADPSLSFTPMQMTMPRSMAASSNAGFYDLMPSQAFQQPWPFEQDHTFKLECDTSLLELMQPHTSGSQDVLELLILVVPPLPLLPPPPPRPAL
ncbi:hypothetical protein BDZ97DRAFT_1914341 [Flammula alnicola]|nr:hypothetical protein BDZ97DRAFT_1914341 [Flammula alnicola]